jgi:membrane protein YqaA with SNARE-associated domain
MISKKYNRMLQIFFKRMQNKTQKFWYAPLVSFLAFVDNFLIIVPTDSILISSTMLAPKKWMRFALFMGIGSSVGALLLAFMVELKGTEIILSFFPKINQTFAWEVSEIFLKKYGLFFVFLIGISPLMQQPAIILAALASPSLISLGIAIFSGRLLKFIFLAYLASHAPKYLANLWGVNRMLINKINLK